MKEHIVYICKHSTRIFLFDNTPIYQKFPGDALNMNVYPEGKQAALRRDGLGEVNVIEMLIVRGVDVKGMNAARMREHILLEHQWRCQSITVIQSK